MQLLSCKTTKSIYWNRTRNTRCKYSKLKMKLLSILSSWTRLTLRNWLTKTNNLLICSNYSRLSSKVAKNLLVKWCGSHNSMLDAIVNFNHLHIKLQNKQSKSKNTNLLPSLENLLLRRGSRSRLDYYRNLKAIFINQ